MRRIIRADNGTRVILILICNDIIDNRYILRVELLYYRGILYWGYILSILYKDILPRKIFTGVLGFGKITAKNYDAKFYDFFLRGAEIGGAPLKCVLDTGCGGVPHVG